MSHPNEFLTQEGSVGHTVPAYSINIEDGLARYRKEQLLLADGLIKDMRSFEGTPDLYVTPGFINCHMHWVMTGDTTSFNTMLKDIVGDPQEKIEAAIAHARATLRQGVTFGWDKAPPGNCALPVYRGMMEAGKKGVKMTRFIYAPWALMFEGGFGYPFGRMVGTSKELDIILMEVTASGANSIKLIPESALKPQDCSYQMVMDKELFRTAREKARAMGILVAVHAKGKELLDQCINAEVDCLEHGLQASNEQLRAIQDRNMFLGPTLYGLECRLNVAQKMNTGLEIAAYEYERAGDMVARAAVLNEGKPFSKMLFSSDAGSFSTPHASIRELYLLRKHGYSPEAVFHAATVNGARCTRQESMGSIRPGKAADLIYWTENPLELPLEKWEHLEDYIAAVVLEGEVAFQR